LEIAKEGAFGGIIIIIVGVISVINREISFTGLEQQRFQHGFRKFGCVWEVPQSVKTS
jgi:hypothetical protein